MMKSVLLSTAVVAFGLSMSACSSVTDWSKSTTAVPWSDEMINNGDLALGAGVAAVAIGATLWTQTSEAREERAQRKAAEQAAEQERIAREHGIALNAQRCATDPWEVKVVDEAKFVYEYCDGSVRVSEERKAEVERAEQMLSRRFEALEPLAKYKTAARACEAAVDLMYKANRSGSEYKMLQAYEEWTGLSSVYAEWKDLISPLSGGDHVYNVTGAGWVAGGALYGEYVNSYTLYSDARAHAIDECRSVDY